MNGRIVETGSVVAETPFSGQWSPCIRRESEQWGRKIGPLFQSATVAAQYAADLAKSELVAQEQTLEVPALNANFFDDAILTCHGEDLINQVRSERTSD